MEVGFEVDILFSWCPFIYPLGFGPWGTRVSNKHCLLTFLVFLMVLINLIFFQISSLQQVLSAQFSETMMFPMSKALQADLEGKLVT